MTCEKAGGSADPGPAPGTMPRPQVTAPRGPLCRKLQIIFNLFLTVSWLSVLVYYLLGQWLDSPHPLRRLQTADHPPGEHPPPPAVPLLDALGFVRNPKLFPQPYHQGQNLPVFVLALRQQEIYSFHRFLGSFRIHYPGKKLVVYNLDLDESEEDFIRRTCQCLIRNVQWERYPPHIKDLSLKAYRPILIQETLHEFGGVFWCNSAMRFNSSFVHYAETFARHYGVAAWPSQDYPTSTYTHHNVLHYFNTSRDLYYFQRMVEPDQALYFNIPVIHKKLMYNWLRCTLDGECVRPVGARARGCRTRRPRYLYSGCHGYDTAVYNVILGLIFQQETPYITKNQVFKLEFIPPEKMPVKTWSVKRVKTPR